ncbi:glycosyltransferase family 2 protein [Gaetbulibacter jejuensis]|uniref:Glycosyltransferase family 2 protein n=1 Tax=Gaetbulibacter jejuensis TaxID=584607 RepID=A0ABN1JW34_9FLAO
MEVAVVIVSYNGARWLFDCLTHVFGSTIALKVIVVDNHSTDASCEIIKGFTDVELILLDENYGFGKANNIGISYALSKNADYVFLLNQDAYLETQTIEQLIEVHQKTLGYGVLSPIHLNGKGLGLDINFSNYIQKNTSLVYDALKGHYTALVYDVPFVNAAGWLVPKETFKSIGGFDPIFYHYGEDVNYCQRLLFHGYKIGVVPNVFLLHDREQRITKEPQTDAEKLQLVERKLKTHWADINIEVETLITRYKHSIKKTIVKQILQLKFKRVFYYKKELKLIDSLLLEVQKSRRLNREEHPHYLNSHTTKRV